MVALNFRSGRSNSVQLIANTHKCRTKMSKLTHIQRFRFTQNDMLLFNELKKNRVNISSFVRKAIREKIERDLPKIIESENKRKEKIKCPF